MKTTLMLLVMLIGSQWAYAQKIQVNGKIYEVDALKPYPIAKSKIYTKDRSVTPLIMSKRPPSLRLKV
jgi:hypothetical protein